MHICVSKLTIIGSDDGLSPERRQAIIWTSAGLLLIGPLGTNFSEILSEIHIFSFKKMHLKTSSAKWRPFCLGPNVLKMHVLMPPIKLPGGLSTDSHPDLPGWERCKHTPDINKLSVNHQLSAVTLLA